MKKCQHISKKTTANYSKSYTYTYFIAHILRNKYKYCLHNKLFKSHYTKLGYFSITFINFKKNVIKGLEQVKDRYLSAHPSHTRLRQPEEKHSCIRPSPTGPEYWKEARHSCTCYGYHYDGRMCDVQMGKMEHMVETCKRKQSQGVPILWRKVKLETQWWW